MKRTSKGGQPSSKVEVCCASPQATDDQPKAVIALDFGTNLIGFAYSFRNNKVTIQTGKRLLGEDLVPFDVLLRPDKTIDSFGRQAHYTYVRLLRKKHMGYRLFSRSKMAFYMHEDLKRDTAIPDIDGVTMPALDLYTMVIKHMTEKALDMVKESLMGDKGNIKETILWVLTIPSIWSDSAQHLMHEVCVNAGITEKQLRLVLESEAVAIYCRHNLQLRSDLYEKTTLPIETKYIVADLVAGPVYICVYNIIENNRIREIFRQSCGAFGRTYVDDQFIHALIEIFGSNVFMEFQREHFYDYMTLVDQFEKSKQNFGKERDALHVIVITVPKSLQCLFQDTNGCIVEDKVRQGPYSESIDVFDGKLIIKRELMEEFFSKPVQGFISCLPKIVNQCKDEDIKSIVLAGWYAEYKYLTDKIQKYMVQFGVEVIVVAEPRFSVLKGAVILGYEDRRIFQRKSRDGS